jgi:hypothetical protein
MNTDDRQGTTLVVATVVARLPSDHLMDMLKKTRTTTNDSQATIRAVATEAARLRSDPMVMLS